MVESQGEKGQRATTYSLSADGKRLTMSVRMTGERLSGVLAFQATFRRQLAQQFFRDALRCRGGQDGVEGLCVLQLEEEVEGRFEDGAVHGRVAAVIRPLINGERDPRRLAKGMDGKTEQLLLSILGELGRLEHH